MRYEVGSQEGLWGRLDPVGGDRPAAGPRLAKSVGVYQGECLFLATVLLPERPPDSSVCWRLYFALRPIGGEWMPFGSVC